MSSPCLFALHTWNVCISLAYVSHTSAKPSRAGGSLGRVMNEPTGLRDIYAAVFLAGHWWIYFVVTLLCVGSCVSVYYRGC